MRPEEEVARSSGPKLRSDCLHLTVSQIIPFRTPSMLVEQMSVQSNSPHFMAARRNFHPAASQPFGFDFSISNHNLEQAEEAKQTLITCRL